MFRTFYVFLEHFILMMKHFIVCREHIIVVLEFLWCPMNYYRDDELNYRYDELNYGYVTNFIPFLICSPLWVIFKKNFDFLSKPPKITFRTPKLQSPIKPFGNIFDRRDPKKPTLNWPFSTNWYPCLDISLLCYSCAVHNNLT